MPKTVTKKKTAPRKSDPKAVARAARKYEKRSSK